MLEGGEVKDPGDFGLELTSDVRRSKRERGVVVERTAFRIDTPGELSEITGRSREGKKRRSRASDDFLGGAIL